MEKGFIDQMGETVSVPFPPARIISVVPSQTELLADLGLNAEVVGITKFCVHPEGWGATRTRIGGTKNLDAKKIAALKPDLIIGNKEENTLQDIQVLKRICPVWMSDVHTMDDAMNMIRSVGQIVNREPEAEYLIHLIHSGYSDLRLLGKKSAFFGKSVVYLIWQNPYMAAGTDTFINESLTVLGLKNAISANRYPPVSEQELYDLQPDYIFLSSEPYPFKEKHIEAVQTIVPKAIVKLVDGEMFSWYGSRMVKAVQYFHHFLAQPRI